MLKVYQSIISQKVSLRSKDIYPFEFVQSDGIEDNDNSRVHEVDCGVGYRAFLLEEADNLLIPKFEARNAKIDGREAVIVLVDGEKEQVESFVRFVRENKPEKAVVEEIRVEEYHGTVRDIEKFRVSFTSTQLSKIIQVGLEMLKKQDETIAAVKEG
jgi:acylphosphatase